MHSFDCRGIQCSKIMQTSSLNRDSRASKSMLSASSATPPQTVPCLSTALGAARVKFRATVLQNKTYSGSATTPQFDLRNICSVPQGHHNRRHKPDMAYKAARVVIDSNTPDCAFQRQIVDTQRLTDLNALEFLPMQLLELELLFICQSHGSTALRRGGRRNAPSSALGRRGRRGGRRRRPCAHEWHQSLVSPSTTNQHRQRNSSALVTSQSISVHAPALPRILHSFLGCTQHLRSDAFSTRDC